MSRVGKNPVALSGAEVSIANNVVTVKGKLGSMTSAFSKKLTVESKDGQITITRNDESREANALSGTTRALVANMVKGVTEGFEKKLQLIGVGYRAQAQGKTLNLSLGFSHPIVYEMPEGVTVQTPSQTEVVLTGADKQVVGQVNAEIRGFRPPEPYKD